MPRRLLLLVPVLAGCTSEPPRVTTATAPVETATTTTAETATATATATAPASASPPSTGAVFEVFKGAERIMTVTDKPGVVVQGGTPPPPAGSPPPKLRPFTIYAHALVPGPGVLEAIETSQSTSELLDRMKALGYRVTR